MAYIGDNDFYLKVACGKVPGASIMRGLGERIGIGITTNGEDLWRGNDLTPLASVIIPTPADVGEQMTIVSESANDSSAGTGVRTIEIHYIDATGNAQEETLIMNGLTGVNTVATDIRFINEMHALTIGSGGVADGSIKIAKTGTTTLVYSMIFVGGNQSLVPHRMVPLGKKLIIRNWHAAEAQDKRAIFRLRSTDRDGVRIPNVFTFKDTLFLKSSTLAPSDLYITVPELSIIKVSVWAIQAAGEASCAWTGVLMNN
jgi:hypothetical protein